MLFYFFVEQYACLSVFFMRDVNGLRSYLIVYTMEYRICARFSGHNLKTFSTTGFCFIPSGKRDFHGYFLIFSRVFLLSVIYQKKCDARHKFLLPGHDGGEIRGKSPVGCEAAG